MPDWVSDELGSIDSLQLDVCIDNDLFVCWYCWSNLGSGRYGESSTVLREN